MNKLKTPSFLTAFAKHWNVLKLVGFIYILTLIVSRGWPAITPIKFDTDDARTETVATFFALLSSDGYKVQFIFSIGFCSVLILSLDIPTNLKVVYSILFFSDSKKGKFYCKNSTIGWK